MAKKQQPKNSRTLVIAVISDVHAYDGAARDDGPSHCCVSEIDPQKNSLRGLRHFISREGLKADILMSPGDLGDKANPAAIQHVWRELHDIKTALTAGELFVATGNHDVDSRHAYNMFDAKGVLQALDPAYPHANELKSDRYWSRHFVIDERKSYRLLLLNSSAFHGEGNFEQTKRREYEHGRISDHTRATIKHELDRASKQSINVLLCHHHPHLHANLGLGIEDLMKGGNELLDLLATGNYGHWLVIHGHKHHPKLSYAAGGTDSPVIFAAGSVAATFHRQLQTAAHNQFYLIEIPLDTIATFGFVGTFRAWDWLSEVGWRPASRSSKLPERGGFGWRGSLTLLADQVHSHVTGSQIVWTDLCRKMPELHFLIPDDLEKLIRLLQDDKKLIADPPNSFPPTLIGIQ
jgi:3',5'-cyclic AMP phosphodiesterase CpdA